VGEAFAPPASHQVPLEVPAIDQVETLQSQPPAATDDKEWHQVHKATPFIKGWIVIVAILYGGLQSFGQGLVGQDPDEAEVVETIARWEVLIVLGIAVIGLIVAVLYGYLAWRRMRYAYDHESVYMNSGILFRQERKARLDRIQSIDIVKPLIARIFGLAELTITSAAGGESNVKIGFLKEEQANLLRIELLARASGAVQRVRGQAAAPASGASSEAQTGAMHGSAPSPDAPGSQPDAAAQTYPPIPPALQYETPERIIYQVPPKRIIIGGLLSWSTIFAVIFVVAMIVLFTLGLGAIALSMLPGLLAFGPMAWNAIIGEYGFTGAISQDGIRVRHGLLETRAKTIPPGRVQAVRLRQSILWRKLGWWRVDVNVAGQAVEANGNSVSMESVLLPVGTTVEALDALWLVLPDLGVAQPLEFLEAAFNGKGTDRGFTVSPRSARWLDPLSYKRNGFAETERALVIRTGWLTRQVAVVPHERTQSIGAKQGPWQRALNVASFQLHSTPGSIVPHVPHQSPETIRDLLAEQAERARRARAAAGPEQWLAQVEQHHFEGETQPDQGEPETQAVLGETTPQVFAAQPQPQVPQSQVQLETRTLSGVTPPEREDPEP
jgi:putative membrane protein